MKARKILALVMVALLSLGILVGCSGKKDAVTGKWNMTRAAYSSVEQSAEELGMAMTLEFKDGKVTVITKDSQSDDSSNTGESDYKLDGNTVTITDTDGSTMTATIDGDTMTLVQGDVTFTLVKDGSTTASDDSTATEAAAATDVGSATEAPTATPAE